MPADWSLPGLIVGLLLAALLIGLAGTRLSLLADVIGERWRLGKTMAGALLLGAATSLSGIMTSVVAAWDGRAELAASNAVGGIAAQTAFLALADILYRRANLEHDAAKIGNILQGGVLLVVLSIALLSMLGPAWTIGHVHPGTIVLVVAYLAGLGASRRAAEWPMWWPRGGEIPGVDRAPSGRLAQRRLSRWLPDFLVMAAVVAICGWFMAVGGGSLADRSGIAEGVVGALGTAVATSLPELVTTVAAVRRGALSLALGGIIGGNAFDVLFLAGADVAYLDGSLYHAIGPQSPFLLALTILMVGVLLLGLISRQRRGPANIGFESMLILVLYLGGATLIALW